MINISQVIDQFIDQAINYELIDPLDQIYIRNRILGILRLNEYQESQMAQEAQGIQGTQGTQESQEAQGIQEVQAAQKTQGTATSLSLLEALDQLVRFAQEHGLIESNQSAKEIFQAEIMDLLIPLPSQVNDTFWMLYAEDKEMATDYFYQLSQLSDYIKTRDIAKNVHYTSPSKYGDLEITINLSKPEKDPKEIALAKDAPKSNYPMCALCIENEGYRGHLQHAARQNHRIIRMEVADEIYGFQYSPYVYYNEHSIFLNEVHKPMKIDAKCFRNLLLIVEQFPHYFTGSNADLPIVGGSILAHDHYQGGHHQFPMEVAQVYDLVELIRFPRVKVELVNWPMTVLRLSAASINTLVEAAIYIHENWKGYSDEEYGIHSHTGETPHNTITPIARQHDGVYELDLVLRNNRTSEEYPEGIFHPHPDVQHIKKENIGLIEVMGLAILPPRLIKELQEVADYLKGETDLNQVTDIHQEWAQSLKEEHGQANPDQVQGIIEDAVGQKFQRVLEDAGVYKQTEQGRQGLAKFIQHLNQA